MKTSVKRILALALCIVMLASCWVFSMPAAVAEEPDGPYDVKVSIEVVKRGWFDDGGGYLGINGTKNATAGVSIVCKDKNGTGENAKEYGWDLGTQGLNYCDVVGNYELHIANVGFPYIVGGYMCGKMFSTEANTEKSFQIQKLEVRAHSENENAPYTELWSGVIQYSTKINGYGAYIDNTGYVTGWDRGVKNADTGSQGDDNNFITLESKYGWTDKMPYANTLQATSSEQNGWPSSEGLTIGSNETVFIPNYLTCYDQYGAAIEEPTKKIYGIKQYDYAAYGLEQSDLQINKDTGNITKSGESYVAGNSGSHAVQLEASYFFGSKKVENETTAAVAQITFDQAFNYVSIPLTWEYTESTTGIAPTEKGMVESTAFFGNMIEDSDYPGQAATRNYYTNHHHYVGGSFESFRATEATTVEMNDYTQQEHSFTLYLPIEGDEVNHNFACECGYAIKQEHTWDNGTITTPATCKQEGVKTYTCTFCSATKEEPIAKTTHIWNEGEITTAPSCGKSGIKTFTCTICGDTKTEPVGALEHEPVLHSIAPSDKHNGGVYYQCENCGCYWGAVYSESMQDYDIPDETPLDTMEQALSASDALPAPYFNTFVDMEAQQQYDYSTRGAALKYIHLKLPDYQPLRFTASVKVPENVSDAIGSEGNAIKDIGIVYSQTKRIDDIADFEIGKEDVYKMSVKEKNSAPVYDGTNWGGVTKHETADGTQLTFNLVVNVKPENWREDYCARAYITYNYNGFEYTVYDEAFSSRSVEYIARQVVANPDESQEAKEYCQSVILNNL